MKTMTFARFARLTMAVVIASGACSVGAEDVPKVRNKLSSVQTREIDRTLDVLLAGLPEEEAEHVRANLEAQLRSRATEAPALERMHPLMRWNQGEAADDLQSRLDDLADDLVKVLRNLGEKDAGRGAIRIVGEFTVLNGANAGDRVSRWLTYSAKVGGVLGLALAAGVFTRWYGVRFRDPTSAEDGMFMLLTTFALAGATGGLTYWDKSRGFVMWLLANQTGVQRRTAKKMADRFWRRVAEGVENHPAFGKLRGEKDAAKIAAHVRDAIVSRNANVFANCSDLFL